jgi:putative protease
MGKKPIGKITRFFNKISVAVVEVTDEINVGDRILIEGATTSFEQKVDSMQVEHENIQSAKKGDMVGMKVSGTVRPGDTVYLAT